MSTTITKKGMRKAFFIVATMLVYAALIWQLYHQQAVLYSMVFVLMLFFLLHFLYLELQNVKFKYLLVGYIIFSVVEIFTFALFERHLRTSLLLVNASVLILMHVLSDETHRLKFSSWGYFLVGGYMFTVFITLGYSLAVLGMYEKFPYTCEELSDASYSAIDAVASPFELGLEEVHSWKKGVQNFFNTKVDDVVTPEASKNILSSLDDVLPEKYASYKHIVLDQVLEDNSSVNMGICEYMLMEINKRYHVPSFQFSVVALMFLLLYGFIRIVLYVVSVIAFVLFKILHWLNIYHIHTEQHEIEKIG